MVTNLDVFRTFVYRVVQIDQRDRTLVVNAHVDRLVSDEPELMEERPQPCNGLSGVYSGDVLCFGGRERDRGLLSRAPGKTCAIDHEGKAGDQLVGVEIIGEVGVTVGGDR